MRWKIYYADGSEFSDEDGEPEDAPGFGVVTIVQKDASVGRAVVDGWDYYYWVESEGKWWGSDYIGLIDRLAHRFEARAVSIGRMVDEKTWETLRANAKTDPAFPLKSGELPGENPRSGRIKFRGR